MQTSTKLMTEGSIKKHILTFAFPIFLGNLFQQLYHLVDSITLGNFSGKNSLAAISSIGPLIFLIVGLFSGIFLGAGVVISKYYGEGNERKVKEAIHTSMAFALASSLVLTIVGYLMAPIILTWMKTPPEVFIEAKTYVQIYFLGISSLVLYNAAAGIIQALGDSKHPLYFLIISSVLNIFLDLLFVGVFKMGTAGVAIATIISQTISAILAVRMLLVAEENIRLIPREIKFKKCMLKQILKVGIPSGIQNSVISFANLVVQSNVNVFGAIAMAGNGAFMRIEGFVFIPIASFAMALTTFTSQNLGAGKLDRIKKGANFGILFSLILSETIGLFMFLNPAPLLAWFSPDPAVISIGMQKAHISSLFFFLLALSHAMAGIFRGVGKATVPMVVMLTFWCIVRVTYISIITKFIPDIRVIFWAYPITWSMSSLAFVIYFIKGSWLKVHQTK